MVLSCIVYDVVGVGCLYIMINGFDCMIRNGGSKGLSGRGWLCINGWVGVNRIMVGI